MDTKAMVEAVRELTDLDFIRLFYELAKTRRDWVYGTNIPRRFVLGYVEIRAKKLEGNADIRVLALPADPKNSMDQLTQDGGCEVCGVLILSWARSVNCPVCGSPVGCS